MEWRQSVLTLEPDARFELPGSPLAGGLTLSKSLNLCVPCFPSCEIGIIIVAVCEDYSDN